MGEISQAKDPKGGGGADNWLSDGGNGEAAPSSGPAETKVAVSQVADDWLSDGHSGAPGGNQEAANKEGLNGDTEVCPIHRIILFPPEQLTQLDIYNHSVRVNPANQSAAMRLKICVFTPGQPSSIQGVEHGPNKTGGTLYGINDHDFWVGTSVSNIRSECLLKCQSRFLAFCWATEQRLF